MTPSLSRFRRRAADELIIFAVLALALTLAKGVVSVGGSVFAGDGRVCLDVWSPGDCIRCEAFADCLKRDPQFRAALEAKFVVNGPVLVGKHHSHARNRGVLEGPFPVFDRGPQFPLVFGFESREKLLIALGCIPGRNIAPVPAPAPLPLPPAVNLVPEQSGEFAKQLEALRKRLDEGLSETVDATPIVDALDKRVGERLAAGSKDQLERILAELRASETRNRGSVGSVLEKIERIERLPPAIVSLAPPAKVPAVIKPEELSVKLFGFSLSMVQFLAGIGLTGAGGVGVPLLAAKAIAFLWRRRRERKAAGGSSPTGSSANAGDVPRGKGYGIPVAIDSPIPDPLVLTEKHYQAVEVDTHRKAFDWACDEVVRKQPGAVDLLSQLRGLIQQALPVKGKK